jgi:hypothetical protein
MGDMSVRTIVTFGGKKHKGKNPHKVFLQEQESSAILNWLWVLNGNQWQSI